MFCLVCGSYRMEVRALHSFPRNVEKSRIWQEKMGMPFRGSNLRHQYICSKHFEGSCYSHEGSVRLNRNAVPTLHPMTMPVPATEVPATSMSSITPFLRPLPVSEPELLPCTPIETTVTALEPQPCCSKDPDPVPFTIGLRLQTPIPSLSSKAASSVRSKKSLFKDIDDFGMLTPRKKKLVGIIKSKNKQLRILKSLCKERGDDLRSVFNLEGTAVKKLFEGMSSPTANFLISQLRWCRRAPKTRMWSLDDKILSLVIMKRSPRCYSLLRRFLALPSPSTLTTLLRKIPFHAGINEHLFKHLADTLQSCPAVDRICTLMFDEMAIKEQIQYDRHGDAIVGLEDHGPKYRSDQLANHALVFMAQGVKNNWKQPLAYYFNRGPASSLQLESILLEVHDACAKFGLEVVTDISDMGTRNVKTLKNMGSTVSHPYIIHNDRRIYTMFDPPHLIKSTRNLFLKYPIKLSVPVGGVDDDMVARWEHIQQARELDSQGVGPCRSLHHLTDAHMQPRMQQTMKVKVAVQVFSKTVSKYMCAAISLGGLPVECLGTATFLDEADTLFDSFNGSASSAPFGKDSRCIVMKESPHWKYWEVAFNKVNQWRFLRKNTVNSRGSDWKPPTQIGWLHSIRAFSSVCNHLIHGVGFESVRPRTFNQDALENLFGAIRSGCGCNDNPTAQQFVSALKTQIINGLTRQGLQGTNCEDDEARLLSDFRYLLQVDEPEGSNRDVATEEINMGDTVNVPQIVDEIGVAVSSGNVGILATAYVSGFIAKRILVNINCEECIEVLTSHSTLPCNLYISNKEFSLQQDRLTYPSEKLVETVGLAITLLEHVFPQLMHNAVEIEKRATKYINDKVDFSWITCLPHADPVKECIIRGVVRIGIPWYCTRAGRELKSKSKFQAAQRKLKKLRHQ